MLQVQLKKKYKLKEELCTDLETNFFKLNNKNPLKQYRINTIVHSYF